MSRSKLTDAKLAKFAQEEREAKRSRRIEEIQEAVRGVVSTPGDAIQILDADRQEWKRRAEEAEQKLGAERLKVLTFEFYLSNAIVFEINNWEIYRKGDVWAGVLRVRDGGEPAYEGREMTFATQADAIKHAMEMY